MDHEYETKGMELGLVTDYKIQETQKYFRNACYRKLWRNTNLEQDSLNRRGCGSEEEKVQGLLIGCCL